MKFKEFNSYLYKHVAAITKGETHLFTVDLDKDKLWDFYLDSFPEGTNKIFRERREYDCTCCRQFVRSFGNVVVIKDNKLVSIWDFEVPDEKYQTVINALAKFVKAKKVTEIFVTDTYSFGTDFSTETLTSGSVKWYHFNAKVDKSVKLTSSAEINETRGQLRDIRNVFKRSLDEISQDSVETVLDLTAQKSLYKGEEWVGVLKEFLKLKKKYAKIAKTKRELFCWKTSVEVGAVIGKIRNHSIGVLLIDISEGMDLNEAVKRYEKMVAPTNYKRPKAVFTQKMVKDAQKTVQELGYDSSLGRRFAKMGDITINNILFANRSSMKQMSGNVFDDLAGDVAKIPKNLDKVEEVSIESFVRDILPKSTEIEVLLQNDHEANLVSLIAPEDKDSKNMLKWSNNFTWAYKGNITDSMRELVVAAGGRVDGALRFTHSWNHDGKNQSLMDLHVFMPGSSPSTFGQKEKHDNYPVGRRVGWNHRKDLNSGGVQDVDFVHAPGKEVPIENITFPDIKKMPEGAYIFKIHNWERRPVTTSGFKAEIECGGVIYTFDHPKPLGQKEWVTVAEITLKNGKFTVDHKMDSKESSKEMWNLKTNQFYPVSTCMFSPNYWDDQKGIGNKHYFFMLKNCKNEETPNGFFNEFLTEDLMKHKRVFEALGSKMKVADSDEQLSGIGFSSTKRAELICKVKGSFTRIVKVKF